VLDGCGSAPLRPSRNNFVDGAMQEVTPPLRSAIQVPGLIEYKAAGWPAALRLSCIEAVQDSVRPLVVLSGRELEDSAATPAVLASTGGSSVEIAGLIRGHT